MFSEQHCIQQLLPHKLLVCTSFCLSKKKKKSESINYKNPSWSMVKDGQWGKVLAADQATLCCWEFVTVTQWEASWIIMSAKINDHLQISPKEEEFVDICEQGRDFRGFFLTAPWKTYQDMSLTGDKWLHSPPDIFCLTLAFTSPPLPLFHSENINPIPPTVPRKVLRKNTFSSFGFL